MSIKKTNYIILDLNYSSVEKYSNFCTQNLNYVTLEVYVWEYDNVVIIKTKIFQIMY